MFIEYTLVVVVLYAVPSTCTLINRVSVVSLWVLVVSLHIDYHVLIQYEYVYREKRLCDFCNDHYDE